MCEWFWKTHVLLNQSLVSGSHFVGSWSDKLLEVGDGLFTGDVYCSQEQVDPLLHLLVKLWMLPSLVGPHLVDCVQEGQTLGKKQEGGGREGEGMEGDR